VPSRFWVALEVVGAATGVLGAIKPAIEISKSFARIVAVYKGVQAFQRGRGVGNLLERLDELRRVGRAANLSDESVERLVREGADEVGDDAIDSASHTGRSADDALDRADDAARAAGTPARGAGDAGRAADDAADQASQAERVPASKREPPTGKRREKLLEERGSEDPILVDRPDGWTASKEAEWRGYPEAPARHDWYWNGDNVSLRLKPGAREAGAAKYHYDGFDFVKIDDDNLVRARYSDRETWRPSAAARQRLSRFARSRQRSQALKQYETDPARVTNAARRMTRASESLGEEAAARWVKAHYPEAVPLHGWPPKGTPGASGEFDQIWKVPNGAGPGEDLFLVVEGKGAGAKLGTANVGGQMVEQGTREYYERTAQMMRAAGKPGGAELLMAGPDQVRYVQIKVPVNEGQGAHHVGDIVVSDFDAR